MQKSLLPPLPLVHSAMMKNGFAGSGFAQAT